MTLRLATPVALLRGGWLGQPANWSKAHECTDIEDTWAPSTWLNDIGKRERERELPSSIIQSYPIIHHGWWVYLVVCLGLGLLALLSFSDGHSDSVPGTTIAGTTRWCATPWRWNPFAAWRWMEHPRTNSIGCSYSWSIIWCRPIHPCTYGIIWMNVVE